MAKLEYTVKWGRNIGVKLFPHRFEDGCFHAYKTNSRNDPEGRRVRTEAELVDLVRDGYRVRMSNIARSHSPSTVKPIIVVGS